MVILKNWCGVTEMAGIFGIHVAILILGFEWHGLTIICSDIADKELSFGIPSIGIG